MHSLAKYDPNKQSVSAGLNKGEKKGKLSAPSGRGSTWFQIGLRHMPLT